MKRIILSLITALSAVALSLQAASLVQPGVKVQKLAGGMNFTEGPAWLPEQNKLVFSDILNSQLMQWNKKDGLSVFRKSEQANGNILDLDGRIISCQHAARNITRIGKDGKAKVLTEKPANVCFGGKDYKTLFITARTSLYQVRVAHAGAMSMLGDPDFLPTAQNPVGWRGDGTGRYLGAAPPVTWTRQATSMLDGFRALAEPPTKKNASKSTPLLEMKGSGAAHYRISQWLVLGPLSPPKVQRNLHDLTLIPNEGELNPIEGQKTAGATWRRVNEADVDLKKLYGKVELNKMAFAFANVYAPDDFKAGIRTNGPATHQGFRVWINGKLGQAWDGTTNSFKKGWNRVLIQFASPRDPPQKDQSLVWNFRAHLFTFPSETRYKTKNVAWSTVLPGASYSMPIVVGQRLIFASEPNDLMCVDKRTGKILWIRPNHLWDALDEADRSKIKDRAKIEADAKTLADMTRRWMTHPDRKLAAERRKLSEGITKQARRADRKYRVSFGWGGGNCAPTPCSDGEYVWAWYGETGVLSCYQPDGKRRWTRFISPGDGGEHGINSSPLLVEDKIVLLGGKCWIAMDKHTGKEAWRIPYKHPCYPSLVRARVGKTAVAVAANGSVVRVSDGKVLQDAIGRDDGECASAIVDHQNRYYLISRMGFVAAQLPRSLNGKTASTLLTRIKPEDLKPTETYPVGSPVYLDGLIYATHSGWGAQDDGYLYVIDPAAGKLVYRHKLDFYPHLQYSPKGAGIAASVVLAGPYLYVMDNRGTTLVLKPGRAFKQVARNTLEHLNNENRQEVTNGTPIFEGKRMYYRSEENLYCIEAP